ncbi:Flp1 family type IVb pilin [Wukongibacter baidiensis]|uniref:Flp1 family type IVb pilin n=1 Tax=Wukongibacter baidiensis TaxID=1723361 RepID=UPI003D7FBAA1
MMKILRDFLKEEDGLGTVEIVLLIAVLVGLALLFKTNIVNFVKNIFKKIDGNEINPSDVDETIIKEN